MAWEDRISRVVAGNAPSLIREMFQRAAPFKDVISLGIGDPDFATPEPVCRAALQDALGGHTHYTASQGDPQLRDELAAYLNRRGYKAVEPGNLLITMGGMGALAACFRALLDQGDQVLIPEPCFPDYLAHVEFAGGEPVLVPTRMEHGFAPQVADLEAAFSTRCKVLIVNSPCNPTGAVYAPRALDELAAWARERDLIVVSDEVYDRHCFNAPHDSIHLRPGMAQRTLVVGSFSKSHAMTGWRLGWAFGPPWLIKAMLNVTTHNTSCPSSVSQRAALAALRLPGEAVEAMSREFAARCRLAWQALSAMPGVAVMPPAGTFYLFPRLERIQGDARQFALALLEKEQVVVVPGEAFGPSGRGCVRLACTVDQTRLAQAMERLARFLRQWRG